MVDLPRRAASAVVMTLLLIWQKHEYLGAGFVLIIASAEFGIFWIGRRLGGANARVGRRDAYLIWALSLIETLTFLSPAIWLASNPSAALMLSGFFWMFGVLIYIANTFSLFQIYSWSLLGPSFALAMVSVFVAATNSTLVSSNLEWLLAAGMMALFGANTFASLSKQISIRRALALAQEEARDRLQALEHMTMHDGLTGLYNRWAFEQALDKWLQDPAIGHITLLMIDLDGFKPVNDTYSHSAGDAVLETTGQRLRRFCGDDDIVARMGGDEFAIATTSLQSSRAAYRFASYLAREIERPIAFEERQLQIGASIGISRSAHGFDTVKTLCASADQAMYLAKASIGKRAVLFDPALLRPRPTLRLREELIAAFESGDIGPQYQPKVSLDTGLTIGFEALARWNHPERGLLPPSEFLPDINQLGLQGDFLIYMASKVLQDIESLIADGLDPGQVSINVPEVTLATLSGRAELDRIFARHPEAKAHIILEITEDVFIARATETVRANIAHFRRAGLKVSLDDFGTGFASFRHLRELEFDELKIDSSFVRDLCEDRRSQVLIKGFLDMAIGLGVQVIAEGVETEIQAQRLRQMGCRFGQGFLYGRAMPLDESRIRLFAEQANQPIRRVIGLSPL